MDKRNPLEKSHIPGDEIYVKIFDFGLELEANLVHFPERAISFSLLFGSNFDEFW